jgi:hypothetical protein
LKSYGPLYAGSLRYWHKKLLPIIEVGTTQETEMPYRKGKCLVFRLPFTTPGFYLGMWVSRPDIGWDDEDEIDKLLSGAVKSRVAWTPKDGLFDESF